MGLNVAYQCDQKQMKEDLNEEFKNLNPDLWGFCNTIEWLIARGMDLDLSSSFESSCKQNGMVIAVDAKWGMGKSFFLEYLRGKIELQGNKIFNYDCSFLMGSNERQYKPQEDSGLSIIPIGYNAWENDYFQDPFISLVGQICSKVNINDIKNTGFVESCKKVFNAIRTISKTVDVLYTIGEKESERYFDDPIDSYLTLIEERKQFCDTLSKLSDTDDSKAPIKIVFIDELDRCTPVYAIKFLEIVKHFFNAPNVVFVIAIDKDALSKSMGGIYGHEFDSNHYLSRLFDVELDLPMSEKFYDSIYQCLSYEKNGGVKKIRRDDNNLNFARKICTKFKLSIREIKKYFNLLQMIDSKLAWDVPPFYLLLVIKFRCAKSFKEIKEYTANYTDEASTVENDFNKFISMLEKNLSEYHIELRALLKEDDFKKSVLQLYYSMLIEKLKSENGDTTKLMEFAEERGAILSGERTYYRKQSFATLVEYISYLK